MPATGALFERRHPLFRSMSLAPCAMQVALVPRSCAMGHFVGVASGRVRRGPGEASLNPLLQDHQHIGHRQIVEEGHGVELGIAECRGDTLLGDSHQFRQGDHRGQGRGLDQCDELVDGWRQGWNGSLRRIGACKNKALIVLRSPMSSTVLIR